MTSRRTAAKDAGGRTFVITREFDAPRELVFRAWTDPKHLAQWWGPRGFTNPVCEWDARAGGKIHDVMRAPNGSEFPMGGQFVEVTPPEKVVFSCGPLDAAGKLVFELLHTAVFTERNGKTKLTLHSRVTMTTPGADRYIGGFEAGMTQSLERLAAMVKTKPLVVERTLAAPVALVWRALTTPEDMSRWYFDLPGFKPEAGCEFKFVVEHEGNTFDHRCRITEIIPQRKIAYTWRYHGCEGESLVTFELSRVGGRTKVRVTHAGLESFPQAPQFARTNFARGWKALIGSSLKDLVEKLDREIFLARDFDAKRELVWEAMTNPKHVVNWWGPRGFSTTVEEMDLRVGGAWRHVMHGPDGANYPNRSVFKEIVKPERIVFTHGGRREGGSGVRFVSTWSFEQVAGGKTRVSIRMVFPSAAARDRVAREFGAVEGGKQTLERLGEYLPKMK